MSRIPTHSFFKTALAGLAFAVVAHAPSAMAVSSICEDDCSALSSIDRGDGTAFDFAIGVSATDGDTAYNVTTKGNIYLVGPLSAEKTRLKGRTILLDGDSHLPEDKVKLNTRNILESYASVADPIVSEATDFKTKFKTNEKKGKVRIKSNGDIYLDITGIDLRRVKLKAKGTIYVSASALDAPTPIPEPTTALLMALGLAGLSMRRADHG